MFLLLTSLTTLYQSLDPTSIPQHLTFYELYKDTPEGKKALKDAWKLLSLGAEDQMEAVPLHFPESVDAFISLIQPLDACKTHSQDALKPIETLGKQLPHRRLKGHSVDTLEEILNLPAEEIDLARALLLTSPARATFEASLDLMALQVLTRLAKDATSEDKVRELNRLIFYEMGFRFPPHSAYAKNIDRFTFLPEVLESRRGVCLGVSTLYLCLAQRIGLDLEIITPPGHIYLATKEGLNIETTLRGVHIPTEEYLGINNRSLEKRTMKEVIGMAHMNHASVWLSEGDWQKSCDSYAKAMPFMPDDSELKTWYGAALLLNGQEKEAKSLLEQAKQTPNKSVISQHPLAEDILQGRVDTAALKAYFLHVDETHDSLSNKKDALEAACTRCPQFRSGLFHLAITWLQLQRTSEAILALEKYHALDPNDITVEFFLAQAHFSRFSAPKTLLHLQQAELCAKKVAFNSKALKQFKAHIAKKVMLT